MSAKVVVVDDTAHVRAMLVAMLEIDGFIVVGQAGTGAQAIVIVDDHDPDVVIMDYQMPGMDGLEAARRIRARRSDQSIILYTAYLDSEIERRAKEAGIALCVGKVEGLPQLERHISELTREISRR
ncbi:MAG: response regulator transcription factor [Actinomycetota bacterium]